MKDNARGEAQPRAHPADAVAKVDSIDGHKIEAAFWDAELAKKLGIG